MKINTSFNLREPAAFLFACVLAASSIPTHMMGVQCDSMAAAALTEVTGNSGLSWALELDYKIGSVDYSGYNKDSEIFMALAVLEWELDENNRLFVEVGSKQWNRSGNAGDGAAFNIPGFGHLPYAGEDWRATRHTGLREVFWEYSDEHLLTRVGLQSMASRDGILLDERVLGTFVDYEIKENLSLQGGIGIVDKDFSRMGKFCATRHSFRPLSAYYSDPISDELGESNLAFIDFMWRPGELSLSDSDGEFDEFSGDGFDSFDEVEQSTALKIKGIGINLFSQFGDAFEHEALFAVGYSKFDLFDKLHLTATVGTDLASDGSNFTAGITADYSVLFDVGGGLALNLGYWYVQDGDQEGRFYPAFSNLFLGEVAKVDMMHAPLFEAGVIYTLPTAWPVYFGVNHVRKTEGDWLRETDYQIGFRPKFGWKIGNVEMGEHLSLVGTFFNIEAATLDGSFDGWRFEARWAF